MRDLQELHCGGLFSNFWLISQRTPRINPKNTIIEPCVIQIDDCFMDARVKSGDQASGATTNDAIMATKPTTMAKRPTPQPTFVNISQHSFVRRSFPIKSAVPARRFCTDADAAASMNDRISEAALLSAQGSAAEMGRERKCVLNTGMAETSAHQP
jgi:hypothetical protein